MTELVREHDAGVKEGLAVVFVHGMEGERRRSWMHDPASPASCWPQWLGAEAGCDTWTAGYDATLATWRDTAGALHVNGLALMDKLATEPELAARPLILIGHDVGGLLLKKAMLHSMSKGAPRHRRMVERIRGLGFVATPQFGGQLNLVAQALCMQQGTSVPDKDFSSEDVHLRALREEFAQLCSGLSLQVKTFVGDKPVTVGRKWLGLLKVRKIAVPFDAASPHVHGEAVIVLPEDHFSISKPQSSASPLHRTVVELINACKALPMQAQPEQVESVPPVVQTLAQQTKIEPPVMVPKTQAPAQAQAGKIIIERPAQIEGANDVRLQPCENKLYGRDKELTRILTFLDNDAERAAIVTARSADFGGIGKTELCKAALKLWLSRDGERKVFHIALPQGAGKAELTQILARGIGMDGVDATDDIAPLVAEMPAGLYYLDNLGEFAASEEGGTLLQQLKSLPGVRLLISSRTVLASDFAQGIEIDALPKQAALNLFRDLWSGGDVLPVDTALTQFVEGDLQRHALSICMVARLGNFCAYDEVVRRWREQRAAGRTNDAMEVSQQLSALIGQSKR